MRTTPDLQAIRSQRMLLQNPYAFIGVDGHLDAEVFVQATAGPVVATNSEHENHQPRLSLKAIENSARNLQRDIFVEARKGSPTSDLDLISLLDPEVAARHLNIEFINASALGSMRVGGNDIDVGGLIERGSNRISVSRRLKPTSRRFTGAHELGHWLLHPGEIYHRDRAIDSPSGVLGSRDVVEKQADQFAAFFLMPRKLVVAHFLDRFGVEFFSFTDDQVFRLGPSMRHQREVESGHRLLKAKILASAETFNGRKFISLASEFRVSVEAMAIHLRELKLID